jgi:hypothetical protein
MSWPGVACASPLRELWCAAAVGSHASAFRSGAAVPGWLGSANGRGPAASVQVSFGAFVSRGLWRGGRLAV